MRRDLHTCSSESAMHHGVPVRVFFVGRRSTTAEATAAAAYLEVTTHMFFSHGRTLVVPGTFMRILYNIHLHVAFASELEQKEKTPSRTNQQYVVQ